MEWQKVHSYGFIMTDEKGDNFCKLRSRMQGACDMRLGLDKVRSYQEQACVPCTYDHERSVQMYQDY